MLCSLSYSFHGGNDTEWKKENLKWIIPELDVNLLVADVVLEVYTNWTKNGAQSGGCWWRSGGCWCCSTSSREGRHPILCCCQGSYCASQVWPDLITKSNLTFLRHASCVGNFAEISDLVLAKVGFALKTVQKLMIFKVREQDQPKMTLTQGEFLFHYVSSDGVIALAIAGVHSCS